MHTGTVEKRRERGRKKCTLEEEKKKDPLLSYYPISVESFGRKERTTERRELGVEEMKKEE